MKTRKPLLDDLFCDSLSADSRRRLFAETMRTARRRVWKRRIIFGVLPAAALVMALLSLRPSPESDPIETKAIENVSLVIVHSTPLLESMIARTQPNMLELFPTESAVVAVITTAKGHRQIQELSDRQLLALLSDRPAAIVRDHANDRDAQLVIPDPDYSKSIGLP